MRYAEYLRKSRADDPSEPIEVTLARHREALRQCMAKHALVVAPEDVFEEVASGDSLDARPQMLKLLEAVEQGVYDGVLCMDIQRLGRGSMSDRRLPPLTRCTTSQMKMTKPIPSLRPSWGGRSTR